jgi:glycosyltransferase involved in cell wall biosynthesis
MDNLLNAAVFTPDALAENSAWLGHLPFAAWLMREFKPGVFVELGTHWGHSYFAFCQTVKTASLTTRCHAVDTWQGDQQAGIYGEEVYQRVNAHNLKHYASFSRLLRLTFDEAAAQFADHSIDLLHIDGQHSYEAVKHDFETWRPKLAPGAVVLFHDIAVREPGFGVWQFWEELTGSQPNHLAFPHSFGLGVLQLAGTDSILPWLSPQSAPKEQLKRYFAALGARQQERFELSQWRKDVENLSRMAAERDATIARLQSATEDQSRTIHDLQRDLGAVATERDEVADAYHSVVNSGWWKITLPMRRACETIEKWLKKVDLRKTASGLTQGWPRKEKVDPDWYLQQNPDVREAGMDPSVHYLRHGKAEGRRPFPPTCLQTLKCSLQSRYNLLSRAAVVAGGWGSIIKKAGRIIAAEGMTGIRNKNRQLKYRYSDRNNYTKWVELYDTLDDAMRKKIKNAIRSLPRQPKISIVMPVYDPSLHCLDEAIRSIRKQLYPNWELCLADDASKNENVRTALKNYMAEDERIKVVFREQNGHISQASNSALELATGEFVALMDNDDVLPEHALYHVARTIVKHPEAALIYSDEDKLSPSGLRVEPYFKPDWNYDLFLGQNLISHLGVYRRDIITKIGGFRVGYEGSQDYDLAARFIEQIAPKQIVHIPRVLYHWRILPGSTALAPTEKSYAQQASQRAIQDHLARRNIPATVELNPHFTFHTIRYSVPAAQPLVSLIIPTHNGCRPLKRCVDGILAKTQYPNYEILIIDNASDESETLRYFDELTTHQNISILRDKAPFTYAALNNAAVQHASGEYVGLIDNTLDVISPEWLDEMLGIAAQPNVGAVGARLWYPNDTLQHGGVITGIRTLAGHAHKGIHRGQVGYFGRSALTQSMSAVTAACLVIKKQIYQDVGGFDEKNLKVAFNDIDFCLRVRAAGYRNVWTPYAELYRHESAEQGRDEAGDQQERFNRDAQYMRDKWGETLLCDPAYNPNLTLDHEDFSLAWPPRVSID